MSLCVILPACTFGTCRNQINQLFSSNRFKKKSLMEKGDNSEQIKKHIKS